MARVLDVPYNELTRFTTKKVMNIAALVISVPEEEKKGNSIHSSSSTSPSLRSQSRNQPDGVEKKLPFIQVPTLNKGTVTSVTSKSTTFSPIISDTPTGTYQDALLGTYAVPTQGPRLKVATEGLERTPFHDASFAKWDIRSVPNATSFDEALIMIAQWNKQIDIGLRFRINFEDGTEVAFRRRRPRDSSTLTYTGTYDPSEVFQQRTLPKKSTLREALGKSLIFTADEKGHPVPKSVQKTQYKMYLSSSMPQSAASTMYDGQRSTCEPTRGLLSKRAPVSSALHFPTPSQRTALFQSLDVNGNGVLSLAELDKAVVEIWPQLNSKPAIMRAYKAADKNGTGWLGKKEFRYFLRYLSQYVNMWRLFLSVDTSGDRRISFAEFQTAQQKALGSQLSEHELRVAFSTMDRNGGGYVLFDEFCAWMAAVKTDALESKETQLI